MEIGEALLGVKSSFGSDGGGNIFLVNYLLTARRQLRLSTRATVEINRRSLTQQGE
jgi:hypothetical protein